MPLYLTTTPTTDGAVEVEICYQDGAVFRVGFFCPVCNLTPGDA